MTAAERGSLVTLEYRYITNSQPDTKARFPLAGEVEIVTNLDQQGATDYANSLFARTSVYTQTYTVPVEGVYALEEYTSQMPRFQLNFSNHPSINPATIFTVIGFSIDYSAGRTTLTVRG